MRRAEWKIRSMEEEQEWTAEDLPILRAAVSLPEPEEERSWRRVGQFYRLQKRAFLQYCKKELLPWAEAEARIALEKSVPPPCFHAELRWQETYHTARLWSLYTEVRETTMPGLPSLLRWGDTWDLTTGYPLALHAFFPPRTPWRKRIREEAEAEILRQEGRGEAEYFPDWRRRLRRYFNPRSFYLTEQGIAFFYPMYALAPAVEGIPTFLLPWDGDAPEEPIR